MHLPRIRQRIGAAGVGLLSAILLATVAGVAFAIDGGGIPYYLRLGGLGINVTYNSPNKWGSTLTHIDTPNGSVFSGGGQGLGIAYNLYYDGTNWRYAANGVGNVLNVANGQTTLTYQGAASGSAGAVATLVQQPFGSQTYGAILSVSGSCSIFNQSPSGWISSCAHNANGNTTLTFGASVFAATPACTVSVVSASFAVNAQFGSLSSSSAQVLTYSTTTPTLTDYNYDVVCVVG